MLLPQSVEKRKIHHHRKNISWIHLFINVCSKSFYRKSVRVNFYNFHIVYTSAHTVFRSFPKGRIKLLILQRTFSTSCWPVWFGQKAQQGSWKRKKRSFAIQEKESVISTHLLPSSYSFRVRQNRLQLRQCLFFPLKNSCCHKSF